MKTIKFSKITGIIGLILGGGLGALGATQQENMVLLVIMPFIGALAGYIFTTKTRNGAIFATLMGSGFSLLIVIILVLMILAAIFMLISFLAVHILPLIF